MKPSKGTQAVAPKRVFIVDDHPLIRESLAQLINAEPGLVVCGAAGSYKSALLEMGKGQPDAAIVDIGLQDVSGLELIKELRARFPLVGILVLSMFDELTYAPRCLKAGARGYVMKSAPPLQVLEGLRKVLAGDMYLSEAVTQRIVRQALNERPEGNLSVSEVLSDREMEVFRMLGRGLASGEIAARLNLSPKTIQTYREHIKQKLGITHAAELMRRAVEWVQSERNAV